MIARSRRWWWVLFWVNLLGSLYGFWWYRDQLLATPVKYWLIVPDSPGATLLFTFFLVFLVLRGTSAADRAPVLLCGWAGVLAALAFVSNMKYGLWTATVLPDYAWRAGKVTPDIIYLSLSHLGMWVQALLFSWHYRPSRGASLATLGWLLFQDYVDYWLLNTHSTLPADWMVPFARGMALLLTVLWGSYLLWLSARAERLQQTSTPASNTFHKRRVF